MYKMRQAYLDLKERQQKEVNEFPMKFAFDEKQLNEALVKLGATKEECVTVFGHGDIVRKVDVPALREMMKRHNEELKAAMLDEKFAEAAFLYEMDNHEYAINWEGDDNVLDCFGYTFETVEELGLKGAYVRARKEHMRKAHEEWDMI